MKALVTGEQELVEVLEKIDSIHDEVKKMDMIQKNAIPLREKLRGATDEAETLVADELWTLPKYREMLFTHPIS